MPRTEDTSPIVLTGALEDFNASPKACSMNPSLTPVSY